MGGFTSMEIEYNLFHPEGAPLRAKVTLSFLEAMTEEMEAVEAGNNSPDLTHVVMVRAGDTLPLLCERIYRDASKYLEIARFNDLDGFRALATGTLLRFPPMR
jgi:nucleoid-associated protein YgaU